MPHYSYLIIGGGITADAAVAGIRKIDLEGSIGVVSAESYPPYNRPPLSKGLWKGEPVESIWRGQAKKGAQLHLGRTALSLNPADKRVVDDQGSEYTFEKLLIATGGSPRRLPFGDHQIVYFRTLEDYHRLNAMSEKSHHFAVIGGGFIGSEIAAALALKGKKVSLLMTEEAIGARVYPRELALYLNDYYREQGVEVFPFHTATGLEARDGKIALITRVGDGTEEKEFLVDGVAAGIGIQPEVTLAEQAGLRVENGIVVDEFLRTSHPDIYAAGDVAAYYDQTLEKRRRVEHEDNALTMGRAAGRAMAGEAKAYHHLPFFYSDLFDLGYEAVGELDARLDTVIDWTEPYREGVIYYLRDARVRGVLLWNVWNQVPAARRLIAEPGPFQSHDLIGRLPEREQENARG